MSPQRCGGVALTLFLILSGCQSAEFVRHDAYVAGDDGAELYLLARGADAEAPVFLWLHGGPGGAERPLFRYYNSDLENHFVVAYWDQRGAGRSFDAGASVEALTIDQHLADLDVIVDHLHQHLGQNRTVLAGHSWGGALGLLYSRDHPDKVSAVIAINPLVSSLAQQDGRYTFLLEEAESRNDASALTRLQAIGPPPHPDAATARETEQLADRYGAIFHQRPRYFRVTVGALFSGLVTPWEIPRLIRANNVTLEAMHDELQTLDLFESVPSLEVPTFFFTGRYDHHVDAGVAADYFQALDAPTKRIVWFEESAHNIPFEQPDLFHTQILELLDSGAF